MKKFNTVLLILVCLLFNIIIETPTFAINVFTEGIYQTTDFNFSPSNLYYVQNYSSTDSAYVLIFDGNQLQIQSIRLAPNSARYNLVPLKADHRVVIVGNGPVYLNTF